MGGWPVVSRSMTSHPSFPAEDFPGQGRRRRDGAGSGHGVARRPRRGRGHPGGALPRHRLPAAGRGPGAGRDGRGTGPDRGRGQSAGRIKPQRLPMSLGQMPTSFTACSPPTASACGRSGSTAGATRSPPGGAVTAKLDAGQGERSCPTTCSSAPGCWSGPRQACPAASRSADRGRGGTAQTRRPVHPRPARRCRRGDRAAGPVSTA